MAAVMVAGWLVWLVAAVCAGVTGAAQAGGTAQPEVNSLVEYVRSDAAFANPERGFYHYVETKASNPEPYDLQALRSYRTDEEITLIYCITYLDTFVDTPISAGFLAYVRGNLETVRAAGLKCILRFAYTDDDPTPRNEEPPFGDATREQVLAHVEQLRPILQEYGDAIALMQAGFIGVWGEWYYTDTFVDDPHDPSTVSRDQYARRREVLDAILASLPTNRMAAVRYPFGKQAMLELDEPLDATTAFQNTTAARTGHHNDCFLADSTDSGTYREAQLVADKAYVAAETLYVPLGGETCGTNPPRSLCATALAEMESLHWSYANREYHPGVYEGWVNGGCIQAMRQRLGYRLTLVRGTYSKAVRPGDGLAVRIELENVGFAALYNPRPVRLLLRDVASKAVYGATLPADPRRWRPGAGQVIEDTIGVHPAMPEGKYELLIHLPDEAPELAARPEYAVQLANVGVWEEDTGANNLLVRVQVTANAPTQTYDGGTYFMGPGLASVFLPILQR